LFRAKGNGLHPVINIPHSYWKEHDVEGVSSLSSPFLSVHRGYFCVFSDVLQHLVLHSSAITTHICIFCNTVPSACFRYLFFVLFLSLEQAFFQHFLISAFLEQTMDEPFKTFDSTVPPSLFIPCPNPSPWHLACQLARPLPPYQAYVLDTALLLSQATQNNSWLLLSLCVCIYIGKCL